MEWILLAVGLAFGYLVGWWWVRRDLNPRVRDTEAELAAATEERTRLESDLAAATARGDRLAIELSEATSAAAQVEEELRSVTAELETERHALGEAQRAAKAFSHAAEKAEGDRAELAEQLHVARREASDAHTKYEQVTEEFVSLKRQARHAEIERDEVRGDRDGTISQLQAALAAREAEVAQLGAGRRELEHDLAIAKARVAALEGAARSASDAQDELGKLRTALAEDRRQLAAVTAELESVRLREDEQVTPETAGGTERPAPDTADHRPIDEQPTVSRSPEFATGNEQGQAPADTTHAGSEAAPDVPPEDGGEPLDVPPGQESAFEGAQADGQGADGVSSPDDSPTDELQAVRGIGPKFERLLHARGVVSYRQIATMEGDEEWETYLDTFGGRIAREDWRGQARALHLEKYGEAL